MKRLSVLMLLVVASLVQAAPERLPIGEFTATRFAKPPVIDGKIEPGEWDRAFTTSGLIVPFDHQLQEAETTMSLGFDNERLYFLFQCRRGNSEWKLWKYARLNDDYSFGEPSVEVWVTPPALVPETYQNILNTYPAVFDNKQIPTRGYTAAGWKGNWIIGVTESATNYIIEASIPIKDFGFDTIKSGDVWRFLLARTCLNAKPRAQASWSITQGFAEIPQHPPVHLCDDELVTQLTGVESIFSGKYDFQLGLVAPRGKAVEADVELRFQKGVTPADDDKVEKQHISLTAGARQALSYAGNVTEQSKGNFTFKVTKADGTLIYRQSFPYAVSGWTPQLPTRPEKEKPAEELAVTALYGPETKTVFVKADIFDLPGRENVAAAEAKVVDPATGKTLATAALRPFKEWYGGVELKLAGVDIPVADFTQLKDYWASAHAISDSNNFIKVENEKRDLKNKHLKPGEAPVALLEKIPAPPAPTKVAGKPVDVIVTVKDKAGQELRTNKTAVELIAYKAEWMNNTVGITDKVIAPWTPVEVNGGDVKVWNRTLSLDGLGLARQVRHGAVAHLAAPMRLVAVKDGQEIEFQAGAPKVTRHVEAEADLTGSAEAAGLKITGKTHVEFDGFVNINLDLAPAGKDAVKLDKLFLEIALPAEKATHFCTTAGGWATIHDVLPDHWTSASTASGMLVGDFVPYIWLTDSDYAFLWFADHDKGWNLDPERKNSAQEIVRRDGKVFLRVNFFAIPTAVTGLRTLTWGWQTFPSRPLPAGWRATFCANSPPVPHTKNTYFWIDADWSVLWPYYCGPFPWSLAKSKAMFGDPERNPLHRPCVGSIAHSIGRYRDYDGNQFPGLAVDWGATPGQIGNSDVTASKGPNDFRLWHYQKWVREGGYRGMYVDENYLALEDNFLTGNAYWRPDGLLQRGYNYVGLREYFKRLKIMFAQNNVSAPNLWQHITSGAAYHAWFGDIFYEGENVEPTDLNFDYIEVLPAGRLRAIGSSKCAGGAMTMMCQSQRHATKWVDKHNHQYIGWVMAHDVLPEQSTLYPNLVEAGHLYSANCEFHPYWKPSPFTTTTADCLVSAHTADGRALLWIVNIGRKDANVEVSVTGFDSQRFLAVNAETGAPIELAAGKFTVPVLQRDFVPVLIAPKSAETFAATFDKGPEADYALGCGVLEAGRGTLRLVDDGKGGQALALDAGGVKLRPYLHLGDAAGRLAFRAQLPEKANGILAALGPLSVQLKWGKEPQALLVLDPTARDAGDGGTAVAAAPAAGWHEFALAYNNGKAELAVDGKAVCELPVRALGFNVVPKNNRPGEVWFGSKGNLLAVDEIRCYRQ